MHLNLKKGQSKLHINSKGNYTISHLSQKYFFCHLILFIFMSQWMENEILDITNKVSLINSKIWSLHFLVLNSDYNYFSLSNDILD